MNTISNIEKVIVSFIKIKGTYAFNQYSRLKNVSFHDN